MRTSHPAWPDEAPIEVILDGPVDAAVDRTRDQAPGDPPHAGRRPLVVVAVVAVVVVVAATTLLAPTDDEETSPADSAEPAEIGLAITMPPTLPPPPSTTGRPAPADAVRSATVPLVPPTATVTARPAGVMTLPSRTALVGTDSAEVPVVDLAGALADLGDDRARRSHTIVQWGDVPGSLEVVVTRDPSTDRHLVEVTSAVGHDVAIIDHRSGTVFLGGDRVETTGTSWIVLTAGQALVGTGVGSLRELADDLLLGPLRASTIDVATVEPARWPELVQGETTVAFDLTVPTDTIDAWVDYPLRPDAPVGDGAEPGATDVEEPPAVALLTAFVGTDGELHQLIHRLRIGGVPQVFVHRLDDLTEPAPIELPVEDVEPTSTPTATVESITRAIGTIAPDS